MDINACIDYLGLNANQYKLDQSVPPHVIVEWEGDDPQPIVAELEAIWPTVQAKMNLDELRAERNQRLAGTDGWVLLDRTPTQAQLDYRQALRDITETYASLEDVVWPQKPE